MLRKNYPVFLLSALLVGAASRLFGVEGAVITIHAGDDSTTKSSSEIIGSSVVTSVSIVLGDGLTNPGDQTTEPFSFSNNAQSNIPSPPQPPVLLTINSVPIPDPTVATATYATNNFIRSLSNPENKKQPNPQQQFHTSSPSSQLIIRNKSQRKDETGAGGVQNVIQALKTIVQEEQQKHDETSSRPTTTNNPSVQPVDETPPTAVTTSQQQNKFVPGSSLSGEDDDEMESSGGTNPSDPGPHTTDAIDDFAKHVVSISAMPEEQESDNDTATSSEVHDAIHKISGAILSVEGGGDDKGNKKPIENILTDVLSSINTARNSSSDEGMVPESELPVTKPSTTTRIPTTTARPTSTAVTPKTTTTKKASTTKKAASSAGTTKKASKPTTTTTKKPPRTQSQNQSQNKLKTELGDNHQSSSTGNANLKKQTQTNSNPSPTLSKHRPQKVELPMIIMLDNDKPLPPRNKRPENVHMEQEVIQTTEYRLPGIPSDDDPFDAASDDEAGGQNDDTGNSWLSSPGAEVSQHDEADAEADNHQGQIPIEYTTLRPYVPPPTKASNKDQYWQSKRPGGQGTSSTRPNEFYDDEIFGYDPYQSFNHGVYVPVVEVGTLTEIQNEQDDNSDEDDDFGFRHPSAPRRTTPKPRRPAAPVGGSRPHTKQSKPGGTSNTKTKKPMPALPDHLHRPRPSHLQYQHGAADDTDPETGLLNAHYQHAGHGYNPDRANPAEGDFISPDKLSLQSRPALPSNVRKNFTSHHDAHFQHQLGIGGAGHGGHGGGHGHGHGHDHDHLHSHLAELAASEKRPNFAPAPKGNPGLEATLTSLDEEKRLFVDINNRLAHRLLSALTNPVSHSTSQYGNMVVSPFTVISSLGMLFLGSRGQTAAQIDGLLQMDDMITFNPHMMYHNVTEAFLSQPNTAAAIIRLLVTDKEKGDVLEFYKTRVQHFYEARVEEVDYKFAGHLAQSIINQMIRAQIQRHSYEMLNYSLPLLGPMSMLTAAFFDGQFAGARDTSVDSMNFIHLAALSQNQNHQGPSARRLFQVPAFALKGRFRATFDKELDATAVELPYTSRDLSLILVMPGKPGEFAFGGVTSLKSRLNLDAWTKLMRGFYARDSFKVIVPRFRHQTGVNLSHTLGRFGLTDMFEPTLAKFKGINGLADLYLDKNMMHFAEFGTWEKLSDTLTENNNRNLDLIRILRPHVREHYGNYGEPMSVNEWFKNRNKEQNQQRSQTDQYQNYADYANSHQTIVPDDVSRLRMELERLKRRHPVQQKPPQDSATISSQQQDRTWFNNNNQNSNPLTSYTKVRGSTVEFRPRTLRAGIRTQRSNSKTYYFRQRQEEIDSSTSAPPEQETVLRFERPFIYVLRHNPTGMILMTGQYTEPLTEVLA